MTVQQRIEAKLRAALEPSWLRVDNESQAHNVPPGSETHFKVILVAERFAPLSRVQRHRLVHQVLADELAGPVHALALHLHTPAEWSARGGVAESPPCLGGSGGR